MYNIYAIIIYKYFTACMSYAVHRMILIIVMPITYNNTMYIRIYIYNIILYNVIMYVCALKFINHYEMKSTLN